MNPEDQNNDWHSTDPKDVKPTTTIIAEIGQAHDGSLGLLHSYIDALAGTGVDAVKFQMHLAAAESSEYERFRIPFSYEDRTRYDYWKRMEFTLDQWREIKEHCESAQMAFICSPFSVAAVEWLEKLKVGAYKIGSGEVDNHLMLERIARTGREIILSSGMSGYGDLDRAVALVRPYGNPLSILQCTSSYPVKPDDVGLNVISELNRRYRLPVGISDHSGTIFPSIAAVALGATIVEVHVVFDKRMFGPDTSSSISIDEMGQLADGIRFIEAALRNPVDKNDSSGFSGLKTMFGKALAANRALPAGHRLRFGDLESKKPADRGIPAHCHRDVIGKKLLSQKMKNEFITYKDIE